MKELKPRDKVTQRMTRDGLVQDNQTTGETQSVSGRDAEQNLSPKEQPELLRREDAENADAAQNRQRQQQPQQEIRRCMIPPRSKTAAIPLYLPWCRKPPPSIPAVWLARCMTV